MAGARSQFRSVSFDDFIPNDRLVVPRPLVLRATSLAKQNDRLNLMQIISGKYRHRKLHTSPGQTTRPIIQRAKVALFDRLQPDLQNARVADIYSGTGTLGFEALSRGAKSVVFFESDHKAFELLQQNVAMLKAEGETVCWRTDASRTSFRPTGAEGFLPFDVVFFDPPYVHITKMTPQTMLYRSLARLARPQITAPDVLLVLRCARDTKFEVPPVWERKQTFSYGSMDIHLYHKIDDASAESGGTSLSEEQEDATADPLPSNDGATTEESLANESSAETTEKESAAD